MKTKAILVLAISTLLPLRADDAAPTWATLDKQAADFAIHVKAHEAHALHGIDHAVADEIVTLKTSGAALPADQKVKFESLLDDLAKQAHRAHVDGHTDKWDDAALAQQQFAADLKAAEALVPAAK